MNLSKLSNLLENSLQKTTDKTLIKLKSQLLAILSNLDKRSFSSSQIATLEIGLDTLFGNLDFDTVSGKTLKHILNKFIQFLNENLNLVMNGYYISYCAFAGIIIGCIISSLIITISLLKQNQYSVWVNLIPLVLFALGVLIGLVAEFRVRDQGRLIIA